MDAISYLLEEHNKFRRVFTRISEITDKETKISEFDLLCKDLINHETMEQQVWYPALGKHTDLREIIKHLLSEEKSAEKSIQNFKKVRFEFMWKLRFAKLKYDVNHHAKEEEMELFPKVRKLYNKTELDELGAEMRKFKNNLQKTT